MEEVMEVDQILEDREVTHGDFEMKAMWIQEIMEHLIGLNAYQNMEADKKEAIHMILVKLSRIIYGNHDHADHWDDIAGYALLVADRIKDK